MKLHKQKARQIVCYAHFQQMSSPQMPIVLRLHFPTWRAVINQEPVPSATRKARQESDNRTVANEETVRILRCRRCFSEPSRHETSESDNRRRFT